ncbi:MAG TPA: rhodanese-like domain-containing protein [Gemmatimonadales bacterium]|nr:rhodanese-like domain-containing protein [Gemmatimonadales bacterium]
MLLKRFYDDGLAQASYLLASERSDAALVVDPNRDVEQYIAAAEAEGLRIAHVAETHIHADFVSGSRELAQRTGATLYLSAEGGRDWRYGYAAESGAVLLKHESRIDVGEVAITALHTPGHTPEHLSFLVVDRLAAAAPLGMLSGDFVFVGDVGRPDLLERAANVQGTMVASARQLFQSLQLLRALPDHLQIWPGHGAGSACGKSLGALPQSTLGYERIANWAFHIADETAFVNAVLEGQPEPPPYFGEMKRINRDGPRILGGWRRPQRIAAARVGELLAQGTLLVDTRPAADYAAAHIPGTINIPLNRSFTTWTGWLVPYTHDFYLLIDHARLDTLDQAVRDLAMIGLDRVGGYIDCDEETLAAWRSAGGALGSIKQITAQQLAEPLRKGELTVIDVRAPYEWDEGHLPGAQNIPLGLLPARITELPAGPVVMQCLTGSRSAIAASFVAARGKEVWNFEGGFAAWKQAGYPVETTDPAP